MREPLFAHSFCVLLTTWDFNLKRGGILFFVCQNNKLTLFNNKNHCFGAVLGAVFAFSFMLAAKKMVNAFLFEI